MVLLADHGQWVAVIVFCFTLAAAENVPLAHPWEALAEMARNADTFAVPRGLREQEPQSTCDVRAMHWVAAAKFTNFTMCLHQKRAGLTTSAVSEAGSGSVVGAELLIKSECWCETGLQDVVRNFGCCEHPNYALFCQHSCEPDCQSPGATQCYDTCPAMCLEQEFFNLPWLECNEHFDQCVRYLRCIAQREQTNTSSDRLACDNYAFDHSPELRSYYRCIVEQPYHTFWHRQVAANHCACHVDLAGTIERHNCCNKYGCVMDCDVDCESAEARECSETCDSLCVELFPRFVPRSCWDTCFGNGARCAKYKVCKSTHTPSYDYFCGDGSAPDSTSGCCFEQEHGGAIEEQCPTLCSVKWYDSSVPNRFQCRCHDCPATREETHTRMNETVMRYFRQRGMETLYSIADEVDIDYPTSWMHRMMHERNIRIRDIVQNDGGYYHYDEALQRKVNDIVQQVNADVLEAARRWLLCEPRMRQDSSPNCTETMQLPQAPPQENAANATEEENASNATEEDSPDGPGHPDGTAVAVLGGALAAVGGLLCAVGACAWRAQKRADALQLQQQNAAPNPDPDVVFGRPLDTGGIEGLPGAAAGAPVQRSDKGAPAAPGAPTQSKASASDGFDTAQV